MPTASGPTAPLPTLASVPLAINRNSIAGRPYVVSTRGPIFGIRGWPVTAEIESHGSRWSADAATGCYQPADVPCDHRQCEQRADRDCDRYLQAHAAQHLEFAAAELRLATRAGFLFAILQRA